MTEDILIRCGGLTRGDLICTGFASICGKVNDGISLRFSDSHAGFVASFADLEKVYLAAKSFRAKHAEQIAEMQREYGYSVENTRQK